MKEIIFIVEDALEGGFTAKALGFSIFTEGDDIADLKRNIIDAVFCHFEESDRPKIAHIHFVKQETFAIAV